jgi:hypothetical protein
MEHAVTEYDIASAYPSVVWEHVLYIDTDGAVMVEQSPISISVASYDLAAAYPSVAAKLGK